MSVWDDVRTERERQDAKWGEQNHTPMEWVPILVEEVGEASSQAVKAHFFPGGSGYDGLPCDHLDLYREEMTHVAAVAIAAIAAFDRLRGER